MSSQTRATDYGIDNEAFAAYFNDLDQRQIDAMEAWYEKENDIHAVVSPFCDFICKVANTAKDDKAQGEDINTAYFESLLHETLCKHASGTFGSQEIPGKAMCQVGRYDAIQGMKKLVVTA